MNREYLCFKFIPQWREKEWEREREREKEREGKRIEWRDVPTPRYDLTGWLPWCKSREKHYSIHAIRSCCVSTWMTAFGNRWIGRGGSIAWPSRSTDLRPFDFYFWGYMKTLVYETPVETELDLVARIQVSAGVSLDMTRIFPRVRHDNQAMHKMYRSLWRPYWAPSVSE